MAVVLPTAVVLLLMSSYANAQGCFSSLDCRGEVIEGLSASQADCCVSGRGLSFPSGRQQCSNCFTEAGFTSEGGAFFAGFFNNFNPRSSTRISKVRFSVDTISEKSMTIFIEALGETKTFSAPGEFEYDAQQLNLRSPGERDKGVFITSKDGDPLSVIALAEEVQSSDAFKVLPCIKLPSDTYEYYTVSVPITQIPIVIDPDYAEYYEDLEEFEAIEGNSAIVIVTTEDDTTLQITSTQTIRNVDLGDDLKDQIPKGEIEAGQTVTIKLSKRAQTLYLPSENDLSGSRVVSDKPIVFTSGHECGTVPSNISYCDQMVEQIPPTATWGRRFITAPFAGRNSGDTFKIVASRDGTVVQISCTNDQVNPISLDKGEMGEIIISSSSSCYFESIQPILVVQFSMSSNVDGVFEGDPFMALVPPVEQYRSRYNIHSFRSSAIRNNEIIGSYFLNILVPADTDPSGVLIDGNPVTSRPVPIMCPGNEDICAYSLLVNETNQESFVLSHTDSNMNINAIVYWNAFRVAYGYFAGMTQRPIAVPAVSLSASEYTEFENTSSVTVTVVRSGDLGSTAAVRLQTAQLTAENSALAGEDFLHVSTTVEFASGETEVRVSIPLIDDVFPEDPETFEVFLSVSPGVYIQSPAAATVLINDRDPDLPILNVSFVETSVTVREGVGVVRFTLEKSRGAVGPVSVHLFTIDGSALAGSDYETIDEVITFEIQDLEYNGVLIISDDDSLENVEQLILMIEPVPGAFPLEVVDDTAVVTITDNDVVVFSIEQGTYSTSESAEMVVLRVSAVHGSLSRTVAVQLTTRSGSATGGVDYSNSSVPQALQFSSNVSTISIPILILTDNLVEPDEEDFFVELTISPQDSESGNIVLGRNVARISIVDDDSATIGIVGERETVREGEGNPRFSVMVMSGELGGDVTLVYSTYSINATAGEDYESVRNALVTLSSSVPTVEVVLAINDDLVYEGDLPESFGVQLSFLSGDNTQRVTIQQSILEILIEDNEPRPVARVGFTQSSYITTENAGSAILLVTSDGNNPDPVMVSYSVVEENTQDGIDVMSTSGSFTLLPGAVLAEVTIPLVQDTTPELEERLIVTLTAGDDVSLTIDSATMTILDSDVADCGPLSNALPANGNVSTSSGTNTGAVALYSCNQGRVLTGSAARVCGTDGLWTPAPPTCEARSCGQLENPANGQVTVSGTTEGSVATYTCDEGFNLSGSTTRTCSSVGIWSSAAPVCSMDVVDCGPLPPPADGSVDTSSGTTAGAVALYSCDQGRVLNGSAARVCGTDGLWTPAPPTCEARRCGQLENPANGQVTVSGTTEGSVATYTCDEGFNLSGSTTRTCSSDGIWSSAAPVCSIDVVDCGPLPPPADGSVDTSSGTTAGAVALYSCDQGRVLNGSSARVCGNDGLWTPVPPTCEGLPPLPESFVANEVDSNTVELLWEQDERVNFYILEVLYLGPCTPNTQTIVVDGSLRAYNLTELEEGSEYSFLLFTINIVGISSSSISIPEIVVTDPSTPSGPPQSLRPTRISSTEVTLEWDEVNCLDRNGVIQEYWLRYFPTENSQQITTLTPSTRFSVISGLQPATSYTFEVAALFGLATGPFSTLVVSTSSSDLSTVPPTVMCTDGDLRLRDGSTDSEGRVELCNRGAWGTVCDDLWDITDAGVACRQLGFTGAVTAHSQAFFGQGTGFILLDNLGCTGSETRLVDCPHNGIGNDNCSHSEDAGVVCTSTPTTPTTATPTTPTTATPTTPTTATPTTPTTATPTTPTTSSVPPTAQMCTHGDVRLVGGRSIVEGRVEICNSGDWQTVCDDSWDIADANVVCQQLGYGIATQAPCCARFGQGTGPIALDNVMCAGTESALLDCRHNGLNNHNCQHFEDAGAICSGFTCSSQFDCGGTDLSPETIRTPEQCCLDNPAGLSYSINGQCSNCVVYGFLQDNLTEFERGQGYPVELGYIKRPSSVRTFIRGSISVLPGGTANSQDFSLSSTTFTIGPGRDDNILVTFRVDSIAQEIDETAQLQLTATTSVSEGLMVRNILNLTIRDSDSVTFQLTESDYRSSEVASQIVGVVTKNLRIANPVTFQLFPYTVAQAEELGLIADADDPTKLNVPSDNNRFSPNRASIEPEDRRDFSSEVITVRFEADELVAQQNDVEISVPIIDDEIDEATEELFVINLVRNESIAGDRGIIISRPSSLCRILDDDVVQIGFQNASYTFAEPPLQTVYEVILEKQNGQLTEQTYQIVVTFTTGTPNQNIALATLNTDYSPEAMFSSTVLTVEFSPEDQLLSIRFILFPDDIPERLEAFQIISEPTENLSIPIFSTPTQGVLFPSTFIVITDDDTTPTVPITTPTATVTTPPTGCTNGSVRLNDIALIDVFIEGRLEVCFNNIWGTVCDDLWDTNDATVACRQLGHSDQDAFGLLGGVYPSGPESSPIYYDNVQCTGTELTLEDCTIDRDTSDCSHAEDAAVSCLLT